MVKKRPSLQNLHLPSFLSRRSDSDIAQSTPSGSPSRVRSETTSSTSSDGSNSDLLDDDPFAADPSRFSLSASLSPSTVSSSPSTPYTHSSRSSASESRSSEEEKTLETLDDHDEFAIPIEPLHRLPLTPTNSIRRLPSRTRLSSSVHPLPCLHELETRLVTVLDVTGEGPRSAVAKAKAKRLPFEPWYTVPPTTPIAPLTPAEERDLIQLPFPSPTPSSPHHVKPLPLLPKEAGEEVDEDTELAYAISEHDEEPQALDTGVSPSSSSTPIATNDNTTDSMKGGPYHCALSNDSQRTVTGGRASTGEGIGRDGSDKRRSFSNEQDRNRRSEGSEKNNGEKQRRDNGRGSRISSSVLSDSDSTSSSSEYSEEDEDSSEDSYGNDSPSALRHTPVQRHYPKTDNKLNNDDTDDDVPLAQRIPTALAAQRTIRRQAKDEKVSRRVRERKRAVSMSGTREQRGVEERSSVPIVEEPRTARSNRGSSGGVTASDLNRRLVELSTNLNLSASDKQSPVSLSSPSQQVTIRPLRPHQRPTVLSIETSTPHVPPLPIAAHTPPNKLTKPRPSQEITPAELVSRSRSTHSHTPSRSIGENDISFAQQDHSLRRAQTTATRSKQISHTQAETQFREQDEDATIRQRRRAQSLSRPSTSALRNTADDRPVPPPVPALPAVAMAPTHSSSSSSAKYLQRIFITSSKKYTTVEMEDTMTAGEIVDLVRSRGELVEEDTHTLGDWMLWELANDCGMERPIRAFERPADIATSWNAEKRVNAFVLKKTNFASVLARDQIPGAPPLYGGYVEWESRKGKWNKRWMELRECSLFLAKKEKSKDEVFLCSLSTFDAYIVSARHRSPKPFTFAVKSADNATLFENPADYMHIFCCDAKSGQSWLQMILITRSYVLQQERTILFRGQSSNPANSNPGASSSGRKPIPAAPLVTVGPPTAANSHTSSSKPGIFEPSAGSLLSKHAA